ncbi:MAG TPA: sugar phosphate isomerase/epimerase family protein [Armatimonadota bacterium]|nr:sugar phosphate isomerase/epimerase family protein [Armatimonadota bacterium]
MRIGMMNDPRRPALQEARWAADHGFEFLDLTVEGPGAALDQIEVGPLSSVLTDAGMGVVGHTAWYLPFASPLERVRAAAVECVAETFEMFAGVGAKRVNVHIVSGVRLFGEASRLRWNAECFTVLAERAAAFGIQIMVEHPPEERLRVDDVRVILDADPRLGFHLDVGHANIGGDRLASWLRAFGNRLVHVHLSDNGGVHDDHIPLGAGQIQWPRAVRLLQDAGYDDTITLEVFSAERDHLLLSARKMREWWQAAKISAA